MIIVITSEVRVPKEAQFINELFHEGLELLHIRKPNMSFAESIDFINMIDPKFHHQLVLHRHYSLSDHFAVSRFHFKETEQHKANNAISEGNILSTSVHDISRFNTLDDYWNYAFMSPFFPSISKKGYGEGSTLIDTIHRRKHSKCKLIALGGVCEKNIHKMRDLDVDGVALLGAIWENKDPLSVFKRCKQNLHFPL